MDFSYSISTIATLQPTKNYLRPLPLQTASNSRPLPQYVDYFDRIRLHNIVNICYKLARAIAASVVKTATFTSFRDYFEH